MSSFSFDLIHYDSKLSPFYDQSKTESERSKEALIRSLNRLNHFNSSMLIDAKFVESDLTIGDYFMNISISSSIKQLVIPTMLSGLTWIRCDPCSSNCGSQHKSLYNPKLSDTYKKIMFDSEECRLLQRAEPGQLGECRYQDYRSGNNLFSSGVLSTESFYLKSPYLPHDSFSDIVFGCDEVHQGNFKDGAQGVVGLGQGPFSLVSQVGKKMGPNANKFSYCLVEKPFEVCSKIQFGPDFTLDKQKNTYKLEFQTSDAPIRYHLNLEAVSINGKKVEIPNKKHDMIVDIQTSLTSLPSNIYDEFIARVKKHFGNIHSIELPKHGTCFLKNQVNKHKRPTVVLHFSDSSGSHVKFPVNPSTLFQETDEHMCPTIIRNDEISILGNRAQINVHMIFDLPTHSLTFAAVDCLKAKM
ncbi:probable aspartic protease At2g35615 [Tripterygium wilfordii]|uniref:probable aspartic protease At2g35615 n=1 Tax=Tripterygium wilfordii TaxID=458696 RepID=UPI0018F8569D|nr:probable aspartic protease At2g35615 [Tripterygium wilfordii]